MTDNGIYHGGAPRVRRQRNEGEERNKIVIDMEEVATSAVDAGTAALVSFIVSRAVK